MEAAALGAADDVGDLQAGLRKASNEAARKMYGELGYEVVSMDGAPSKQICTIRKNLS